MEEGQEGDEGHFALGHSHQRVVQREEASLAAGVSPRSFGA